MLKEKKMIQLTFYLEPCGKARARTTIQGGKAWTYTPDKTAGNYPLTTRRRDKNKE